LKSEDKSVPLDEHGAWNRNIPLKPEPCGGTIKINSLALIKTWPERLRYTMGTHFT